MNSPDPILFREIAVIGKIIEDETWLEGERRGCAVSSDDPTVRDRVCSVVLRIGQEMRETFEQTHGAHREKDGDEFDASASGPLSGEIVAA
ncbi:MAG: hypothetical protein ABIZ49_04895 [Opitutaceae bacterium]